MLVNKISSESFGRVYETVEEIKSCCEVSDDYDEWYDIAGECMQMCFEDLYANQVEMTVEAWFEYVNKCSRHLSKGIILALEMCLEELISLKDDFISEYESDDADDEFDSYDTNEAKELKACFEKCLVEVREVKENIIK